MLKRFHSVVDITPPYTSALQNILGLSPRGTKYTCHFPRQEIKVKTTEAKMDVFCLAWLMGYLRDSTGEVEVFKRLVRHAKISEFKRQQKEPDR